MAVEDDAPSTTRDRVRSIMTVENRDIQLTDTGGVVSDPDGEIEVRTQQQVERAFESCSLVLFVVSLEDGLTAMDRAVADRLRDLDKPILLVANKEDAAYDDHAIHEFHELGMGSPVEVSALHRNGLDELKRSIASALPDEPARGSEAASPRLALMGRQNVGKSTFLNAISGSDRAIVTDEPGTTRDLIEVKVGLRNRSWNVVDTPGMVRRGNTDSTADLWSQKRLRSMIKKADVVLHLIDATSEVTRVDKRIAERTAESFVPHVLVVNKWDLVLEEIGPEEYSEYLYDQLVGTRYCPISMVSSLKEFHLFETLELAVELYDQAGERLPAEKLTRRTQSAVEEHPPPAQGKSPTEAKVRHVEQVGVHPPHLEVHVNDTALFPDTYRRYLENEYRSWVPYAEVPVRIQFVEPAD